MTNWIKHDGGPQPVADDVWVSLHEPDGYVIAWLSQAVSWQKQTSYRILNQHLIDAARLEGIRLGLEAAAKVATEKVEERIGVPCPDGIKGCLVFHFRREYRDKSAFHIGYDILALDPETIAREAADKETAR